MFKYKSGIKDPNYDWKLFKYRLKLNYNLLNYPYEVIIDWLTKLSSWGLLDCIVEIGM